MVEAAVANEATDTTPITKENAYEMLLKGTEWMGDHKILNNYVCFATPRFYNLIKLDSAFIKSSELGQKMLINGQVGEIDGMPIVKVPAGYMPGKVPLSLSTRV